MLWKWACILFLWIICIISQKPSNQGKIEYRLFICVALVAIFKCPVCLFACTVLWSVAAGTREATHFLSRKTPVKTHQTHDSLWFQTMHMPCTLTCEAYCPAQSVLQGQSVVMSFLLARAGRRAAAPVPGGPCTSRILWTLCDVFPVQKTNLKTLALLGFTKETEI